MSDGTKIEWTDATWNPITGCTVVSPGCTNCYAMGLAGTRLKHHQSRAGLTDDSRAGPVWNGEVRFNEQWLDQPLRWRKPRSIFVCAHGDLFHPAVPDEWIDRVFAVMALCPDHRFQVLTKRADRMREYMLERWQGTKARTILVAGKPMNIPAGPETGRASRIGEECETLLDLHRNGHWRRRLADHDNDDHWTQDGSCKIMQWDWPLPNVWLGVSVEDQTRADERIPDLLATPAAVRWISAEPLLGPVDLTPHLWGRAEPCEGCPRDADCDCGPYPRHMLGEEPDIAWVVVGGESGPSARPMHPDWARSLRDQCQAAGVPYFFKQWGAFADHTDTHTKRIQCAASSDLVITPAGHVIGAGAKGFGGMVDPNWQERGGAWMCKVGKARAGRLLDRREWNEVPA